MSKTGGVNNSTVVVRGDALFKEYYLGRTELPVLKGVSVSIRAGELVAITGSSGSGKSTLLHVLSGLDVPQRGQVFVDEAPIFEPEGERMIPRPEAVQQLAANQATGANLSDKKGRGDAGFEARRNELRNTRFGFVFQFYHLLPEFNVLENVMMPRLVGATASGWMGARAAAAQRARALLERVGLTERIQHRPNELSGGERQRVSIARALMNEPTLLFADEPTGNLDGKTGRSIFALLQQLNDGGQTIVMVTHDQGLATEARRTIHLVDGQVESDG